MAFWVLAYCCMAPVPRPCIPRGSGNWWKEKGAEKWKNLNQKPHRAPSYLLDLWKQAHLDKRWDRAELGSNPDFPTT